MNKDQPNPGPGSERPIDYQRALIDYQRRIETILESFTDAFFEVTADWTVTYWNREAERLLDMPREGVLGRNLWEVYRDAVPLKFYQQYHRALEQHVAVRFEEYFPPKDIWVEVAAFPSGHGLSIYFKDISQRKQAVRLLELEKQKYSDLFNLSPLPQWVYELDTLLFLDVNEAAIAHYGYSREEFMSMTIGQIRPQEDVGELERILETGFDGDGPTRHSVRHQKKNGQIIEVFVVGNPLSFGQSSARLVMVIDRTVELRSIRAMEQSIERFDIVSKATSDAIWDLDMRTGKMVWNKGIRGIFGFGATVYDQHWWRSRIHPDDLLQVTAKFDQMLKEGKVRLSVEYRFRRADGSYRYVLDRSFMLMDPKGQPVRIIGSMQDITQRIQHLNAIEAQNRKFRELAWMQAHVVRGPLANIMGLASLVDRDTPAVELGEILSRLKLAAGELDRALLEMINKP